MHLHQNDLFGGKSKEGVVGNHSEEEMKMERLFVHGCDESKVRVESFSVFYVWSMKPALDAQELLGEVFLFTQRSKVTVE